MYPVLLLLSSAHHFHYIFSFVSTTRVNHWVLFSRLLHDGVMVILLEKAGETSLPPEVALI